MAVERNYIKRLLSEAMWHVMQHRLPKLSGGWDIVLSARNQVTTVDLHTLEEDLVDLLQKARLLEAKDDIE